MRRGSRNARAGFTLLETLISSTLLVALFVVVSIASISATDAYEASDQRNVLSRNAFHALSLITEGLTAAGRDGLNPDPEAFETSLLEFARAEGFDGEEVEYGPPIQIRWELDPGELDDGLDNDGDGLVDEGQVVWVDAFGEPDERARILCRNVREYLPGELPNGIDDNGNGSIDEQGLSFTADGDVVTVRLSLEQADSKGRLVTRTVESSTRLWND